MVTMDGSTGVVFGTGEMQPKNPSTAVSLHLLGKEPCQFKRAVLVQGLLASAAVVILVISLF